MVNHRIDRMEVFIRWKNDRSGIVCCYEREISFPLWDDSVNRIGRLRNVEILLLENAAVNKLYVNSYETD